MFYELKAKPRKEEGKKVRGLRAGDKVPAVIYGPEVKENIILTLGYNEFKKIYDQAGENSLINLMIEGETKPRETLVKDVSYEPLSDRISHVDFYQIKEGQKLEIKVGLKLVGESPAVKSLGGVLFQNLNELGVKCLAKDMISEIEIDISNLTAIDDKIVVRDLKVPSTLEITEDLNTAVVIITLPEEEKVETAATVEMPKVEGEEKKEGEEGAEAKAEPEKKAEKK
ncbi:MAG: 50S ribosomal protein L25 [Patescibacteria group bacterium]